ncbi:glucose 1-dehydrogenase 1-like [Dermatophagoides pteronyssinus]|nr:uncharacterized protein LOC113794994 [Dermatophagoides pteronyssinus]KAH9417863.1 hypothetical protein DERP_013123 [Dermatophagoides pteronyssinus]
MSIHCDFSDKVVLITGSSSGIGEGIAVHLCSLGANITITGRNAERLKRVGERCRQSTKNPNAKILEIIGDINQEKDAEHLLNKTIETFGKLDVLVNNAGAYQVSSIWDDNYMQNYDMMFHTNVRSVVYLTKLAIPFLAKTQGNIVNVSSVAAQKPAANNTLYAMSKSAIDMFTKSMALELGPKRIRCNAINPAAIRTPIFNKVQNSDLSTDRMADIAARSYPVGRIGEPLDCANAVAYLASDAASFINGVCLLVDGGSVNSALIMPDDSKK